MHRLLLHRKAFRVCLRSGNCPAHMGLSQNLGSPAALLIMGDHVVFLRAA